MPTFAQEIISETKLVTVTLSEADFSQKFKLSNPGQPNFFQAIYKLDGKFDSSKTTPLKVFSTDSSGAKKQVDFTFQNGEVFVYRYEGIPAEISADLKYHLIFAVQK